MSIRKVCDLSGLWEPVASLSLAVSSRCLLHQLVAAEIWGQGFNIHCSVL